jgi:hypothetical protein
MAVPSFRRAATRVALAVVLAAAGAPAGADPLDPPPGGLDARAIGSADVIASGTGTTTVRIHLARGSQSLTEGTAVRADILAGDAAFAGGSKSADLITDRLGDVALAIAPGRLAGMLRVRLVAAGSQAEAVLSLIAAVPRPIVVGFATVGSGPVPGWIEAPDNAANGTLARRGQIAAYGSGKISGNTIGTFAYNTADTLGQSLTAGPFVDDPNERPFSTYGDSSIRRDDALSTNRFYGRLESGKSSAMWGEFYAQNVASRAIGGYNVLVNGARLEAAGGALDVRAFTASNHTAFDRRVISPTGLAIADQPLYPDIVVGSDTLTLVHLDRVTGATVSQSVLVRGSDYVLDYASGLLRFTNILLPLDDAFNPQVVVVQYQYGGSGARSTMLGGGASLAIGRTGNASAWYLNDTYGAGNLSLLGQALSGSSTNASWSLSHEYSNGFLTLGSAQYGSSGNAYFASLDAHEANVKGSVTYENTNAAYDNPYGAYSSPGMRTLNAKLQFALDRKSELDFAYVSAINQLPATTLTQAVANGDARVAVTLHVRPTDRFAYHAGFEDDAASSNGVINPAFLLTDSTPQTGTNAFFPPAFAIVPYQAGSGRSIDADLGVDWKFAPHASVAISRLTPLGSGAYDSYDPPQTQAEVDLDAGPAGKLFVRQLWQRTSVQALAATQASQTEAASASSSTSIGFSQRVGSATFESGYAVDHTASGADFFDAVGVRGRVLATKRLTADGFVQIGQELLSTFDSGLNGSSPYFIAAGTSLAYAIASFRANGQIQVRTGYNSGSTFQLGAAGSISPAVSLFGAFTGSFTQDVRDSETRVGVSYRPSRNDRYVTLFSVDSQQSNLTNYDAYVTNVAQLQELYRPWQRTELAGSLAYKISGDAFFAPQTTIVGLRADQRVGSRFDLAAELHRSDIAPLNGVAATGLAIEAGQRVGSSLRLAAGYNFSGFSDPAASVNPTHRGLYFTVSSYLDRIFGWGKGDAK